MRVPPVLPIVNCPSCNRAPRLESTFWSDKARMECVCGVAGPWVSGMKAVQMEGEARDAWAKIFGAHPRAEAHLLQYQNVPEITGATQI